MPYGKLIVEKDMVIDGATASANIVINPDGKQLGNGPCSLIGVTDVMANMSFYFTTIKFYTQDGSGNYTVAHTPVFTDPEAPWSVIPAGNGAGTFNIPDCTAVKIEYKARIDTAAGQPVNLKNEVWVRGFYAVFMKNDHMVTSSNSEVEIAEVKSSCSRTTSSTRRSIPRGQNSPFTSRGHTAGGIIHRWLSPPA